MEKHILYTFFDEFECSENDNLSVGSKGSTATNKSTGSAKSVKISTPKKKSLFKDLYISNYILSHILYFIY